MHPETVASVSLEFCFVYIIARPVNNDNITKFSTHIGKIIEGNQFVTSLFTSRKDTRLPCHDLFRGARNTSIKRHKRKTVTVCHRNDQIFESLLTFHQGGVFKRI